MESEPTRDDLPTRVLRLLALLQSRREWSGAELAERLGVTRRTVRRDIDRLRALDYPVVGTTGTAGGYRLTSGERLPPLQLTDDEAVAVAAGLVRASGGAAAGVAESSMRALAKLERMLPARLRPRLATLARTGTAVERGDPPPVDAGVMAVLAGCAHDREIVSFDYRDRHDRPSGRRVEPHGLVTVHGLWYLLAYDPDRADWRTFRVDRIDRPARTHRSCPPRQLPAPDAASYLRDSFASASYRYTARMAVRLPAETVRAGVFGPIPGEIREDGAAGCVVRLSAESPELVTQYVAVVAALGGEFTLDTCEEITSRLRGLGNRFAG
ncbi:DeoR faimly transcriptional regulator [Actinopolyspora erythraea]|uniref:DeoR faimly transcriptional regulator n=1 Tax=Actinopolyspora erythraea TaxID=414996 RepID=A0ABR4X8L6_9ACTN|nr:DeoR faimly transcriptional regulator [Actinopolyspora erythraea]